MSEQETLAVRLANPQRTSAGDPPADLVVTLPPGEARELLRQGLAARVPAIPDDEIVTEVAES